MSFWQKALFKSAALMKAVITLLLFVCSEYAVLFVFEYLGIDKAIYRGTFNFLTCGIVFGTMFLINKLFSNKNEKLIHVKKLGPDQVAALVIIGLGMLGMVSIYLGIVEWIAESRQSVNDAVEVYRESVDRFSNTPQTVIPVWDSVLYVITLSFIVPLTEEMTFRGVVIGHLRRGFGPWISVLLSAVGFGLLHGLSIHIGYAFACGLIIASCYYLTDSLIASLILHIVFNVFGSGIPTFMSIEYFGIPKKITSLLMRSFNTTELLFMPVAVLAFAYLVSVKRKKDKEAKEAADSAISADKEKLVISEENGSGVCP